MLVEVHFYSYFRDLTGTNRMELELTPGGTISDLLAQVYARCPDLGRMAKSTLIAVGVEYQNRAYVLQEGDVVSLFPPVQGG